MENSNHESFYVTARIGHRYDASFYVSADDFPSAFSAAEIKLANKTREPFIVTAAQHSWSLDKRDASNV